MKHLKIYIDKESGLEILLGEQHLIYQKKLLDLFMLGIAFILLIISVFGLWGFIKLYPHIVNIDNSLKIIATFK